MHFSKTNHVRQPMFTKLMAMAAGTGLLFINTIVLADQAIVATGMLVEHGDVVNRDPGAPFGGNANFTTDDLCAASPFLGMAINIEPGDQGIASMVLADHTTRDVMTMNLARAVTATAANPIIGGGWSEGIELVSTGQTGLIGDFETEHFTFRRLDR